MNSIKLLKAQANLALSTIDKRARIGIDNYIAALENQIAGNMVQIDFHKRETAWSAEIYGEKIFGFSRPHILRLVLERAVSELERNIGNDDFELHLALKDKKHGKI